jgi:hypothetical protein
MNAQTDTLKLFDRPILEGAEEVLHWRITDKWQRKLFVNLFSLGLLFPSGFVFYHLARIIGGMPEDPKTDGLVFLLSLLSVIPLHEIAHGIMMRRYGGNPRFGFLWKGLMFYTTCPNHPFQRDQYLRITFAPFVGISLLAVCCFVLFPGSDWLLYPVAIGTLNATGCGGDFWIGVVVLRFSSSALIVDERDGIRVFANNSSVV